MAEIKKTLQDFINEIGDPNAAFIAYAKYLAEQPKAQPFIKK